ncbi:hypothetical protein BDB01DRAFT_785198 [Pilobolus umbonatus]|nr:hypothetical protein BDB01DRAFT_785198 [Pilobolus umbonatus]
MSLPNFPLFLNALQYASDDTKIAIDDKRTNTAYTYKQLVNAVAMLRNNLLKSKK